MLRRFATITFAFLLTALTAALPVGAQPARPNYPQLANLPSYDPRTNGGRIGDPAVDNIAFINAASAAASAAGGGTVRLASGDWYVDPDSNTDYIRLYSNVAIVGESKQTRIRVKNDAGNYQQLFGNGGNACVNAGIYNLTVDQNYAGNTTCDITNGDPLRCLFGVYLFGSGVRGITIDGVSFNTCVGVNTIVFGGPDQSDFNITNCSFLWKKGATTSTIDGAPGYDNTVIYTAIRGGKIVNNRIVSDDYADLPAGAIEIHGVEQTCIANHIEGFQTGISVLGAEFAGENQDPANILVTQNVIHRAYAGGLIFASSSAIPLKGVTYSGNRISLYQAGGHHDSLTAVGIGVNDTGPTGGVIEDLSIDSNEIDFEPDVRATSTRYGGAALTAQFYGIKVSQRAAVRNVKVRGNTIRGCPLQGMAIGYADATANIRDSWFENNVIIDAGANPNIAAANAVGWGAFLDLNGKLTNVRVRDNRFVSTGDTSLPPYLARVYPPAAAVDSFFGNNTYKNHSANPTPPTLFANEAATLTGTVTEGSEDLTYAATITPEPFSPSIKYLTATGNVHFAAVVPGVNRQALKGHRMTFVVKQDATGGRAVTWDAQYTGMTPALTGANQVSVWEVGFNGTAWVQLSTSVIPVYGTAATRNVGTSVGNVAEIESGGKLNASIIPAIPATDVFVVASQAAMLALATAGTGDIAKRTDTGSSFILTAEDETVLANWVALTDAASVVSVNGESGAVTLTTGDINESGANLWYTTARVNTDAPAVTLNAAADTVLGLSVQQLTLDNQTPNFFLAGPPSGVPAGAPAFRAIVLADIPSLSLGTGTADATTFLRGDRTWQAIGAATTTGSGFVELATLAETDSHADTVRAVTPSGLANHVLGTRSIATSAPLTGGGDLSANRTLGVTAATETATGVVELATTAEVVTGTDTTRATTAAGVLAAAIPRSSFLAKGNVLVGTGAGTFASLGVGADNQVLTADAAQASGVKWAAAPGGTTILTMRQTADLTRTNTTPTAVPDMSFDYTADTYYRIEWTVFCTSVAATTGYAFTLDVTTAPGTGGIHLQFEHGLAATGTLTGGYSVGDNGATVIGVSSAVPVAGQEIPVTISCQFHSGATPGTAQLMFRPETSASATIKAGSVGQATVIP